MRQEEVEEPNNMVVVTQSAVEAGFSLWCGQRSEASVLLYKWPEFMWIGA